MTKSMTGFLRNLKRSKYDFIIPKAFNNYVTNCYTEGSRGMFFFQKRKKSLLIYHLCWILLKKKGIFDHFYLPPLFTRIFGRLWQAFHTTRWKLAAWNMVVRKWNMACPKAAEAEAVCLAAFFSSLHLLGSSSSLWRPPVVRSITIW